MISAALSVFCAVFFFTQTVVSHEEHAHEPEVSNHHENQEEWAGSRNMNMRKLTGVDLRWVTKDVEYVTMEMKARTTGYVAVGFCEHWHGTMQDCDIVLGWVADNGTGYIRDYYARSNEFPEEDYSQDYYLVNAAQDEYETRIQFRRKWETGDPLDVNLKKAKVRVIYAWHPVDPIGFSVFSPHDRSTRGHTLKLESFFGQQSSSALSHINRVVYIHFWIHTLASQFSMLFMLS